MTKSTFEAVLERRRAHREHFVRLKGMTKVITTVRAGDRYNVDGGWCYIAHIIHQ